MLAPGTRLPLPVIVREEVSASVAASTDTAVVPNGSSKLVAVKSDVPFTVRADSAVFVLAAAMFSLTE